MSESLNATARFVMMRNGSVYRRTPMIEKAKNAHLITDREAFEYFKSEGVSAEGMRKLRLDQFLDEDVDADRPATKRARRPAKADVANVPQEGGELPPPGETDAGLPDFNADLDAALNG